MLFHLTVEDPAGRTVRELEFESGELTFGRLAECDVQLESGSVSRKHARLLVSGPSCVVEDLGSANGVYVDGTRINGVEILRPNATVKIGDFLLRVQTIHSGANEPKRAVSKLLRIDDDFDGELYPLMSEETSIGRVAKNDIQVSHESISRYHARIVKQGDRHVIVDLQSANGTRVNGTSAERPILLTEGDRVAVGQILFIFGMHPESAREQTARSAGHQVVPQTSGSSNLPLIALCLVTIIVLGAAAALVIPMLQDTGSGGVQVSASDDDDHQVATPQVDLRVTARAMRDAGDWQAAVTAYQSAIVEYPEDTTLRDELVAIEAESVADVALGACTTIADTAAGLEAGGQAAAAAQTYEQARTCLVDIADGSQASATAHTMLDDRVIPALVALYRYLGSLSIGAREFVPAIESYTHAQALYPEGEAPADITAPLRTAYLGAGDAAFDQENWQGVVDHYSHANTFEPLGAARAQRLENAQGELE